MTKLLPLPKPGELDAVNLDDPIKGDVDLWVICVECGGRTRTRYQRQTIFGPSWVAECVDCGAKEITFPHETFEAICAAQERGWKVRIER